MPFDPPRELSLTPASAPMAAGDVALGQLVFLPDGRLALCAATKGDGQLAFALADDADGLVYLAETDRVRAAVSDVSL